MVKKKISLAMALAMLLTLLMPNFVFGATDYSGHWAEKTIQEWFDNGKLQGYEDGSFRPDTQITRAEFMTMVNNAFEYTEKAEIGFSDVDSDDWYYPEVQKAVQAGYLLGYEDNTARPGNKISRQEAALIIARIKDLSDNAAGANKFGDSNEIASWAKGGVGAATAAKLIIGYEDSTFRPLRYISRAEALVIIDRATGAETPGEEPGNNGGGGNGGGNGGNHDDDDDDDEVTTSAAIIALSIDGGTPTSITPSAIAVTTPSTIVVTTSSAVTISAITKGEAEVVINIIPPNGVTTPSFIKEVSVDEYNEYTHAFKVDGLDVLTEANEGYIIELTVSKEDTSRTNYIDTTYRFILKRTTE